MFWKGKLLCGITSQNAYDYFSRDDDGQGKLRGQLVEAIKDRLEKRDKGYQARWNQVWADPKCQQYKRPEHETGGCGHTLFITPRFPTSSTSLRS